MNKPLKEILLSMAHLPKTDQRWILNQLSSEGRTIFEACDGLTLLEQAQRFRILDFKNKKRLSIPKLPLYCSDLAKKTPLYIAIILEQGLFQWQPYFLKQFDNEGLIYAALSKHVTHIKPLVKQSLFFEWKSTLSFNLYLEEPHG